MANLMTVIIKGEAPDIIKELPEVKWFGYGPIKTLESNDLRKQFGDTLIYTRSALNTISFLVNQCDFNEKEIFWQDLDAYGESRVFQLPTSSLTEPLVLPINKRIVE